VQIKKEIGDVLAEKLSDLWYEQRSQLKLGIHDPREKGEEKVSVWWRREKGRLRRRLGFAVEIGDLGSRV
jgi:hypothetical protein